MISTTVHPKDLNMHTTLQVCARPDTIIESTVAIWYLSTLQLCLQSAAGRRPLLLGCLQPTA